MSDVKIVKYIDCQSDDYTLFKLSYDVYIKLNCTLKYFVNYNTFEADEILNGIYLGNINSVYDIKKLKELGITDIISVIEGFDPPYVKDFNYLVINAIDTENTNLSNCFDVSNEFINNAIENNKKVLIHCTYGKSRSVTILAAYIISTFGMNIENTLKAIKSKRNIINPNKFFIKQLEKYYDDLYAQYIQNI